MFAIGGNKYADLAEHGVGAIMPYTVLKAVVPAATALPGGDCRGIWASADMTVGFTDPAGNAIVGFPLAKGRNDVCASVISAVSAGSVWACY